jgi:tyrosine-protein phosphatase YwqE
MKKLFVILISLFLVSGVYAKQYLYTITLKNYFLVPATTNKAKEDLEKVLFDLILKGFEIVEVIPSMADGFTVGYTIIYKDNK